MDVVYFQNLFSITGFALAMMLYIELRLYRRNGASKLGMIVIAISMALWAEIGLTGFAVKEITAVMSVVARRDAIAIAVGMAVRCFLSDRDILSTGKANANAQN